MKQTWNDLLFAHYPIKLESLKSIVPNVLPLDSFNGMGWIGVVPFYVTNLRLRGLPSIAGTNRFPQLNVRTYIKVEGKPGLYFFSLDAMNWLSVRMAKMFYHLPYVHADMEVKCNASNINYESRRRSDPDFKLICSYRPIAEQYSSVEGSFEQWATDRYCLYTLNKKREPLRCDIMHHPWVLQHAEAEISYNSMLVKQGIQVEADHPILHFSKRIDGVKMWPLVPAFE